MTNVRSWAYRWAGAHRTVSEKEEARRRTSASAMASSSGVSARTVRLPCGKECS
uniref:Uncharacterized protein n=1 Tax=Arundo donax TaxID=35708 RepID=A0A0A9GH06_ARUDO